jgi:hypothetical protein
MARRVTPKTYKEQQTSQSSGRSYPKFSDIIVNLSVTNLEVGEDKSVRLRLVGLPITYKEYNDKKWVPGQKGKTERVPFPDAHLNKSLTRIGHDDESQCPWKAEGYIASAKYAQNVLEYDAENKTWVPKILNKGASIFDKFQQWTDGRLEEYEDLDEDEAEDFITHLGVRMSPCVRIKALKKGEKAHEVEYTVTVESKPTPMTDEMIEILRSAGEPSAEQAAKILAVYKQDQEDDPTMPEWEDFFALGHDLDRIFKFTQKKDEDSSEPEKSTSEASLDLSTDDNDDDDEEEEVAKPVAKAKTSAKTKAKVSEPEPNPFDDEDDDDLDWTK